MKYNKNAHQSICPVNPTTHDNVAEVQDTQFCEKNKVPPFFLSLPSFILQIAPAC